jgi:hypothetical protein
MGVWKIYMIKSENSERVYIGSDHRELGKVLRYHINRAERYERLKCFYLASYEVLRHGGVSIIEIEEFEGKRKIELLEREYEYIMENLDICVNIFSPLDNNKIICKNKRKAERDILNRKKELEDFISGRVEEKMSKGYSLEESKILAREEDIKEMDNIDNNIEEIYERWMAS